jgi:predicted N-acyltransferase
VLTHSAHLLTHPGLRRAVDDYLQAERPAIAGEIEALADLGPFRAED